MKYKIVSKESRYGEVIDFVKTSDRETIHIVERLGTYKLRRVRNTPWIWDLSKEAYSTLKEAEAALLSGDVDFKLEGCGHD